MTRAASLGGVRGPLPSVHAERLATREIITGEFRPCGVQSQIFSPARARCGSRRLIATRPRKVPLLRPISMIGPAAILAPDCYRCYGEAAPGRDVTGWGSGVCPSRKCLSRATIAYPPPGLILTCLPAGAHSCAGRSGPPAPGGALTPRPPLPYTTCPAPSAACPVRERGRRPAPSNSAPRHPLRQTTTPPPKLGEGSTAVARNERKGGRGRGPASHRDAPSAFLHP